MGEGLKPCPFCGGEAYVDEERMMISLEFDQSYPDNGRDLYINRWMHTPKCRDCGLSFGKSFTTTKAAADAWNRRAGDAS